MVAVKFPTPALPLINVFEQDTGGGRQEEEEKKEEPKSFLGIPTTRDEGFGGKTQSPERRTLTKRINSLIEKGARPEQITAGLAELHPEIKSLLNRGADPEKILFGITEGQLTGFSTASKNRQAIANIKQLPSGAVAAVGQVADFGLAIGGLGIDIVATPFKLANIAFNDSATFETEFGDPSKFASLQILAQSPIREGLGKLGLTSTREEVERLTPVQQEAFRFGELVGSFAAFGGIEVLLGKAALKGGLGKFGASIRAGAKDPVKGGNILTRGIAQAADRPVANIITSAGAGAGAGAGGFVVSRIDPENPWLRFSGELAGAILSPAAFAYAMSRGAGNTAKRLYSIFNEKASIKQAERYLKQVFKDVGEEPAKFLTRLEKIAKQGSIVGTEKLTTGEVTGSRTLLGIEQILKAQNSNFKAKGAKSLDDTLKNLEGAIARFKKGNNNLMELGVAYITHLENKVLAIGQDALKKSMDAFVTATRGKTITDFDDVALKIGNQVLKMEENFGKLLEAAYKSAGKRPSILKLADVKPLIDRVTLAVREFIPAGENVPNIILGFLKELKGGTYSTNSLIVTRKAARQAADKAFKSGDNLTGNLMKQVYLGADDVFATLGKEGFAEANQLAKVISDFTKRTYSGSAIEQLRLASEGGFEAATGKFVEKIFTGGPRVRAATFTNLERAAGKVVEAGAFEKEVERVGKILGKDVAKRLVTASQEARKFTELLSEGGNIFLRAAFRELSEDGATVTQTAANRFLSQNGRLIDEHFPGLRILFEDVAKLSQEVKLVKGLPEVSKLEAQKKAFQALFKFEEDLTTTVKAAMASSTPAKNYEMLANLARSSRNAADNLEGLAGATIEAALHNSFRVKRIDFIEVEKALFSTFKRGSKSVASIMHIKGVMTKTEINSLRRIVREAARLQKVATQGVPIQLETKAGTWFGEFLTRVFALRISSRLTRAGILPSGGAQLAVAQRVSSGAGKIFNHLPVVAIHNVLLKMAKDRAFAADMLRAIPKATGKAFQPLTKEQIKATAKAGLMSAKQAQNQRIIKVLEAEGILSSVGVEPQTETEETLPPEQQREAEVQPVDDTAPIPSTQTQSVEDLTLDKGGLDFLISFENTRANPLQVYNDKGVLAAGPGIRQQWFEKELKLGEEVTAEEMQAAFRKAADFMEGHLEKKVTRPLTQNQYNALFSLVWQAGPSEVPDTIAAINAGVSPEDLRRIWLEGFGSVDVLRRRREVDLYLS